MSFGKGIADRAAMETGDARASATRKIGATVAASCLLVVSSLGLSGCESMEGHKQEIGSIGGAVGGTALGAWVGNKVGGQTGAWIGGALGGALGGFIGNKIGQYLDEEDQKKAAMAVEEALDEAEAKQGKPSTVKWSSDTNKGVGGTATATAVADTKTAGSDCYEVQQVVSLPDRGDVREQQTYCRVDGKWAVA